MTHFHSDFGEEEREVSFIFVDKRHGVDACRHVRDKWVRLTSIQRTVQRVKNMFDKALSTYSLGSQIFAGGGALAADCETLLFRLGEKDGWRAF